MTLTEALGVDGIIKKAVIMDFKGAYIMGGKKKCVVGYMYGSKDHLEGAFIHTSTITKMDHTSDPTASIVTTKHSRYRVEWDATTDQGER